jgi:regulator of RNase E activity RraA
MPLDNHAKKALQGLTTATITSVLVKKGLRNVWIRGTRSIHDAPARLVGIAFTLRFIPEREDLATPESLASSTSTRGAIEDMPEGCVAVIDSGRISDAGVFGDILCARMVKRNVAGLITDGAMRDLEGVMRSGLPVWCSGGSAPPSYARLTFVGWQQPIGCGGVAVIPGDVVVADQDGAVIVPEAMVHEVIEAGKEAEAIEQWIYEQVQNGAKLPGLYPPDAQARARYEKSRSGVSKRPSDRGG